MTHGLRLGSLDRSVVVAVIPQRFEHYIRHDLLL